MEVSVFPRELAAAWSQARRDASRPLTPEEWDVLFEGRELLFRHLPEQVRNRNLVLEALRLLRSEHFRVDEARNKNYLGVLTLLRNSPLECESLELRGRLIKAASVLAVRRHMGRLLRIDIGSMDYFAEEFCSHGYVVGRGVKLAGTTLGQCNAQIYVMTQGVAEGFVPKTKNGRRSFEMADLEFGTLFLLEGPASERRAVYAQPVANAKAGYLVPSHRKPFYERGVWNIFFKHEGTKFYVWEVRGGENTALSRNVKKIAQEALHGR